MTKLQGHMTTGCAGDVYEILQNQRLLTLTHINIKHIQVYYFQRDLTNANVGVLQINFEMSYSCECQDEMRYALWSGNLAMLLQSLINQNVEPFSLF